MNPTYEELLRIPPEDTVGQIGSFILARSTGGLVILKKVVDTWVEVDHMPISTIAREITIGTKNHMILITEEREIIVLKEQ